MTAAMIALATDKATRRKKPRNPSLIIHTQEEAAKVIEQIPKPLPTDLLVIISFTSHGHRGANSVQRENDESQARDQCGSQDKPLRRSFDRRDYRQKDCQE
jgi:hypothetical protein